MKKLLILTAALAVVLAGCQRPSPDQMAERVVSHLGSTLSLDASQSQKLNDLVQSVREVIVKHQSENSGTRDELGALLSAPTLDQAKLRTLIDDRFGKLETSRPADLDLVIPKLAAFLDSLKPDQKKKLQEQWDRWRSWGKRF